MMITMPRLILNNGGAQPPEPLRQRWAADSSWLFSGLAGRSAAAEPLRAVARIVSGIAADYPWCGVAPLPQAILHSICRAVQLDVRAGMRAEQRRIRLGALCRPDSRHQSRSRAVLRHAHRAHSEDQRAALQMQ